MAIVYRDGIPGKICANPECGWKPLSEYSPGRLHGVPVGDGYKYRCKDCFRAQARAERAAKIEQYRAQERKYVESKKRHYQELKRAHQKAHPEKYQVSLRKYRDAHRENINAKARERCQRNIEHYREVGRKSREKHAVERNAYQREYGKRNRDKLTLFANMRRARKLAAGGSHSDQEWQALKTFYDYRCLCCGKREPKIRLTRDHVISLTQGGTDSIDNVQPLCARCNSKKNNKHIDYR
jgi:5-methylcytosine-specific restriction endonuclease McrA